MIKVIETNLSMNPNNIIIDHQSRVVQVDSWESYINEIKEERSVSRLDRYGSIHGCSFPIGCKLDSLKYDEFHLTYNAVKNGGLWSKELAYRIAD